jgi:hypothetical protein
MSDARLMDRIPSPPDGDPAEIRRQLDRILSDSLFKNSRRYPKLLQYVVEHTLDNIGPELKERTLGVDVFGRNPDYDTATDPVVRITAAEVRKRLASYYGVPGRESEVRIGLPAGSYVPEFKKPAALVADPAPAPGSVPLAVDEHMEKEQGRRIGWWPAAAALALGMLFVILWWGTQPPISALDAFWKPVLGKSDSVLISIGQRAEPTLMAENGARPNNGLLANQITLSQLYYLQSENIAIPDALALARLGGLLQSKHLRYRIRGANQTSLEDFRSSPVVLIGAFTNEWNLRLNKPLRFSLERQNSLYQIRDRKDPSHVKWSVDYDSPYLTLTRDYALITRVVDPASDRMVMAAGGLGGYGTQAAGEFLTEPAYMQKVVATAPAGWERKNMQVVISTRVINGNSGPPEIVCATYW